MSDVKTMGVVGAGPMGQGIAQIGLQAGLNVVLYDLNREALEKSAATIFGFIEKLEGKGKLEAGATEGAKQRLKLADAVSDFAPCEAVIEAIIERLEPKQKLFAELEGIVASDAILASNTSSLSVAEIAAGCQSKDRICGLHFFNPVPLMKLVEVVAAPNTSNAIAERAIALSKVIGKVPVRVKDGPGFLVNLQGRALSQEGLQIVQEGVTEPAVVDRVMRDAMNFRMGPFELMDLTGIDVNYPASTYIYEGYQHDARLKTTTLHALMFNSGSHGRKTGSGFFDYSDGVNFAPSPEASANPPSFSPKIGEASADLDALAKDVGWTEGDDVTLIAPIGEDCATACARLGLDPKKTVGVDCTARGNMHLTVMSALGGGALAPQVADWLRSKGFKVEVIKDSPGFVLQRVLGMVSNLGCELAQIGVGSPEDIDLAMKLAQNYPKGPMEIADWLGLDKVHTIMRQLHAITGSDRYRPALWLRRRAMLGLSVYEAD
ncbi:MAG: 3-hydroxyacyl-CoA dehydrogenase [Sphingomonadaceae bacterium]|nr:3-hydroxyacyl-CoA dehydrogenase [Sphingomonadaceae bacterium]